MSGNNAKREAKAVLDALRGGEGYYQEPDNGRFWRVKNGKVYDRWRGRWMRNQFVQATFLANAYYWVPSSRKAFLEWKREFERDIRAAHGKEASHR